VSLLHELEILNRPLRHAGAQASGFEPIKDTHCLSVRRIGRFPSRDRRLPILLEQQIERFV
jgi:hypothetical protein